MYRRITAFSLVEVIIVVLILGIVSLIVVPKFSSASTDARNAALETSLASARRQIEVYKAQHNGKGPHLNEAGNPDPANFVARLTGKTDPSGKVDANGQCGPYLMDWPSNPFLKGIAATSVKFGGNPIPPRDDSSGWYYCINNGTFHVNSISGDGAMGL